MAESNETFYNKNVCIEVVHLGIVFVMQPKLGSYDVVKNEEFQHNLEFALQAMKRPTNAIVRYVSL